MKTLFFMIGMLSACDPADVKFKNDDSGVETQIGAEDHTGAAAQEEKLEPVGVIPSSDCRHIDIGDKACNFRLTDQNGDVWDLYSHTGDVIVLDLSAVWCPPCQAAGYYTQSLQDDYASEGVQIVTVLIDGATAGTAPTTAEITEWVDEHVITTAPTLQGSRDKMLDQSGIEGYSIGAWPTYIYIGRDMKFYAGHVGFSESYIRQMIEQGL